VTYAIADEPHDTAWKNLVVSPSGPLLAEIVVGSWMSLPWFAINAIALGSPTKRKEIVLCVVQLIVTALLGTALLWADDRDLIESRTLLQLLLLVIVAWKLYIAHTITTIQQRVYQVYEAYGGPARATTFVIAGGILLRPYVQGLFDDPLWDIIVMGMAGQL
jgi:hypothetical protein